MGNNHRGWSRYYYCCPPTNSLLTQSEAESITGVSRKLGYEVLDSKRSSCAYVNGKTAEDLYSVVLDVGRFEEDRGPSNEVAHRQAMAKDGGKLEGVVNVGDSAIAITGWSGGVSVRTARDVRNSTPVRSFSE